MTKVIIGFAGKKGSGKSTAAIHLKNELGFEAHSFAFPMRDMLYKFLGNMGVDLDEALHYLLFDKETVIPQVGKSARVLLQTLGTEWGRLKVDCDIWVKASEVMLLNSQCQRIVFDDVRFENEAAMIRGLGGLIIHVDRLDSLADEHCSERGIMRADQDTWLPNDRSVSGFLHNVESMVQRVFEL